MIKDVNDELIIQIRVYSSIHFYLTQIPDFMLP